MCQEIAREGIFRLSHCKYFKTINTVKARAFTKDPEHAKIKGLCYKVNQSDLNRYTIFIKSWEYNIYNEYYERPVLSFSIAFDYNAPHKFKITAPKIMSCPVILDNQSALRFLEAASLIMRQVQSGTMIDVDHVLGIYRIKPTSMTCESINAAMMKQKKSAFEDISKRAL